MLPITRGFFLGKLVPCTVGRIFDVAIDLRAGSPTLGQWVAVELSAGNKRQIYIPAGFGHACQAVSDVVEGQYKQTGYYMPDAAVNRKWTLRVRGAYAEGAGN